MKILLLLVSMVMLLTSSAMGSMIMLVLGLTLFIGVLAIEYMQIKSEDIES